MHKIVLFSLMILVSIMVTGCLNNGSDDATEAPIQQTTPTTPADGNDSDDDSTNVQQKVSFKTITNAWFEQAPEDTPPSTEDVDFEFDADEDPEAFVGLLAEHVKEDEN